MHCWVFGRPICENKIAKKLKINYSRNLSTSKKPTIWYSIKYGAQHFILISHNTHTHTHTKFLNLLKRFLEPKLIYELLNSFFCKSFIISKVCLNSLFFFCERDQSIIFIFYYLFRFYKKSSNIQ